LVFEFFQMIEVISKNVTIIYGIFMNKTRQNGPRRLLKCLTPEVVERSTPLSIQAQIVNFRRNSRRI